MAKIRTLQSPPDAPAEKPHLVGYARVSMSDQNTQRQIDELIRAGVDERDIFTDSASGKTMNRPGWRACWRDMQEGDVLVVLAIDRLGRNLVQIIMTVEEMRKRGIGLKVLNGDIDTTTATGRMLLGLFATLAQWERELIVERSQHGLDKARARGVIGGRPPKISADMIEDALRRRKAGEELGDIAASFGVHRNSLYKRLEARRKAIRAEENQSDRRS